MLKEVGVIGAAIIVAMIVREIFGQRSLARRPDQRRQRAARSSSAWAVLVAGLRGLRRGSLGQPMFIFLMLIMIPLATTELGTDSWITPLMEPEMSKLGLSGGWVLVYTSLIMLILRFFAGPIVHKLSPLGLLCVSSAIAACGLVFLSKSTGLTILAAATLYGLGKTFFWPTMLGVVGRAVPQGRGPDAEHARRAGDAGRRRPRGPVPGVHPGHEGRPRPQPPTRRLRAGRSSEPKQSVFGNYRPLDPKKVDALPEDEQGVIEEIQDAAKRNALTTVAIFPCMMLVCYLGLIVYFRTQGGYKPKILICEKEEALLMTGGAVGRPTCDL